MRTWLTSCFVLVLGCLVIACSGGGGVDPTDAAPDGAAADASIDAFEIPDPNACGTGTTILPLPVGGMASGSAASITPGNVSSTTCQGRGAETVYLVTVDHAVTLAATTDLPGTTLDTVLYVRAACQEPSTELGCNDDLAVGNIHSSLTVDLAAGSYYLIVDGRNVGAAGNYELAVNLYEGVGQPCTGPGTCAPGYTCRAIPPSTQTTCERHACDDGRDDDSDGDVDYPNDPGCTAATDDSETDPCPGVGCPVCADGVDNDGDGVMDYPTDPGCVAASWGSEQNCIPELDPVTPIVAGTTTGSTIGAGNHFRLIPNPLQVYPIKTFHPEVSRVGFVN